MSYADVSLSDSTTQANKFGDFTVGGDKGLRNVVYIALGVIGLGMVLWFFKGKAK